MSNIPIQMATQAATSPVITPSKCPACGKDESIKEVCGHCGHVYEKTDDGNFLLELAAIVSVVLIVSWFCVTVIYWMSERNDETLAQILLEQWEFIRGLRIW